MKLIILIFIIAIPHILWPASPVLKFRRKISDVQYTNYYSAEFDGSTDYLTLGSAMGVTPVPTGTLSLWLKRYNEDSATLSQQIAGNTRGMTVSINASEEFQFVGRDQTSSDAITMHSSLTLSSNEWHHIVLSFDTSTSDYHMYLNGTNVVTLDTIDTKDVDYDRDISVGGTLAGGTLFLGLLCEYAFWTNYIDLSVSSNREKFRTSDGKPVDLGSDGSTPTGVAASIYLNQEVPDWEVNQGTEGGLTENGTLVDGGADKP